MKRTFLLPTLLGLALLSAAPVAAQTGARGLWIGAKWGQADVDADLGDIFDAALDGDEDILAYEVGWRFNNWLAVQGSYWDLGDLPGVLAPCDDPEVNCIHDGLPIEAETTAYSVSLVPQIPLTRSIFLFAKAGVIFLESDVRLVNPDAEGIIESLDDEDILYGAGVRLRLIARLSIFYEYEWLGSDLEVQSLGASWSF